MKFNWKESRDFIYLLIMLASAPYWYTDNGGDPIDSEIWWGLYLIIFVTAFPLVLGKVTLNLYRSVRYSRKERETMNSTGFIATLSVGWLIIIPIILSVYKDLTL
ncbi:hypothetical protein HBA55_19085 [Pseudomaricurvus alkylphenolicus]|uniref:hypothetical protein n=1 Tax=Pseudomaricurvus alkylphenolicus TaxID=1306991 RepID=UPI001421D1B3|nr:hypothetical protein [Pseudomaricurvus alkylphenolicus]NIB41718.1 hypothetical protein [Pseudomaricurvus alkylphenolicus]